MTQLMPSYDGNKKCNMFEHVSGVSSKMADHIIQTYFGGRKNLSPLPL